jgi:hypothetical protein
VAVHEGPRQAAEDRRRLAVWTAYLGASRPVESIDRATLDGFVRSRRAGTLKVPDVQLAPHPTDRTVGADLEFLRRVCNWALTVTRGNGKPLLTHHPLTRYAIPTNANPRRPVATYDRYPAIRQHTDEVDRQKLFGLFLDLVEGLGWRVSAICKLWASDVELTVAESRPFGRLRKRPETDKMGVGQWVPMSASVRAAVLAILDRNAAIGDVPLFPAPRRPGQPWTRHHAKDLLERARLLHARRLSNVMTWKPRRHSLRSMAATSTPTGANGRPRESISLKDVAEAGGGRSTETLLRCYTQTDEAAVLAVVSETRKVRSAGSKP